MHLSMGVWHTVMWVFKVLCLCICQWAFGHMVLLVFRCLSVGACTHTHMHTL